MHENRTAEQQLHDREYERERGKAKARNPAKTTRCVGCGKLCWRSDKRKRDEDHLWMDCRGKRNLVHCDHCGKEYQRRQRKDQPGRHNYCSTDCLYADKRAARDNKRSG